MSRERLRVLTIRVTADEHAMVKEAAFIAGVSMNGFCAREIVAVAREITEADSEVHVVSHVDDST